MVTQNNRGPIAMAQESSGHWVAHLCYDNDECVGGYNISMKVLKADSSVLCVLGQPLLFQAGFACDPGCEGCGCSHEVCGATDAPTVEDRVTCSNGG